MPFRNQNHPPLPPHRVIKVSVRPRRGSPITRLVVFWFVAYALAAAVMIAAFVWPFLCP